MKEPDPVDAISISQAQELLLAACLEAGTSVATAQSLVRATLSAARHGARSMGFPHFMDYLDALQAGRIDGRAEPRLAHTMPTVIQSDARRGIAQLGFDRAFDDLSATAHAFGTCLFAQRNSYTAGELGYYVRRLAAAGFVALAVANGPPLMAAAAGGPRVFCTNPLAFGAPLGADAPPFIIDQATSATAFVKIAQAAREGAPIPAGWAIDSLGQPTTDAAAAVDGALLPFGGYRGANLALMVEIMAAGLACASWSIDAPAFDAGGASPGAGLTVIALKPADAGFATRLASHLDRLGRLGVSIPSQRLTRSTDTDLVEIPHSLLARLERQAET